MRSVLRARRRGLSMMEVVVATALVGVVVVGGLNAAGQSARAARLTADRTRAAWLADALLAEMMAKPAFADAGLGREAGEAAASRSTWDDVNDYWTWVSTPPVDELGVAIAGAEGLTRVASVQYASTTNLASLSSTPSDVLVLQVSVRRGSVTLATRTALRTRAGAGVGSEDDE